MPALQDEKIIRTVFYCFTWSFYPFCFYGKLSGAAVPTHYNFLGEADAWGSRSFFWFLPLISVAFFFGLSIIEKYYPKLNYPVKVTAENANSLYKLGLRMLRHVKCFSILLFAYINNTSLSVALSGKGGFNGYVFAVLIIGLIAGVWVYIIKMFRVK